MHEQNAHNCNFVIIIVSMKLYVCFSRSRTWYCEERSDFLSSVPKPRLDWSRIGPHFKYDAKFCETVNTTLQKIAKVKDNRVRQIENSWSQLVQITSTNGTTSACVQNLFALLFNQRPVLIHG